MEARINYHIRGIFILSKKSIPPTLNKHLTNEIFNKPNKEAMEQVLYYLLPLTDPNCLKSIPWPITTFKEASEFRNVTTNIINGLKGFVYEKSSNVSKVNSSLLANPGGPIFISFMYQLCLFIKCCEIKKKGLNILNTPLYVEDNYTDRKISMFNGISNCNFNEVNDLISHIDNTLKNTSELFIKWKEIFQNSKLYIKNFKLELFNVEHCELTENEVAELKEKVINLQDIFEQKKLIAMKCAKLADIILNTPETCNANTINLIFNLNKEEFIEDNEEVDLIKLLKNIKCTLNNFINWCENLNNENINNKSLEIQKLVIDMTKQIHCYEKLIVAQNGIIDNLKIENQELDEVFINKTLANVDLRLQSVYKQNLSMFLTLVSTDKPKILISDDTKKSRRSILLHSINKPYNYQTISLDNIKEVYKATLPNSNEIETQDNEMNISTLDFEKETDKTKSLDNCSQTQIKEDEVKNVSISRKSIENIKQKFIRIKNQSHAMSTIPHSPRSPF